MANYPLLGRVLRSALFEDWLLKFICLGLAVLMWFYIDGELMDQRDFTIGLRMSELSLPTGYELAPDHSLPKFTVRVRGTRRRLQFLEPGSINFKRKALDNPQPGRNVISFKPADVEADSLEILSVAAKDEEALVHLIATVTQAKPVRVKPRGEPKPSYRIGAVSVEPTLVNVQGSSRDLDRVEFVWTEEVDINGAESDIQRDVGILQQVMVEGRRVPIRTKEKVRVTIPIEPVEVVTRKTLEVRPITIEGTAMTVDPKSVDVEIIAEERMLADAMASIILYVEWPSTWEKPKDPAAVLGPVRAQVRAVTPPRVQVRGIDDAPLPTVDVRGAMAGALGEK